MRSHPFRLSPCPLVSLSPCLFVFLTIACSSPKPRTFLVSVDNKTDHPLTVGFIKHGPPFDPRWASPEDFAGLSPSRQPAMWGMVIPPGRAMQTRETASMTSAADPVLRIYLGDHPLNDLLAISKGSGQRLDLGLTPSQPNDFVVTDIPPRGLTAKLRPFATPRPAN